MGYGGSHRDAAQAIGEEKLVMVVSMELLREDRLGLDKISLYTTKIDNSLK